MPTLGRKLRADSVSKLSSVAVMSYVTPDEFKSYETVAYAKGFLLVASSPLTRSSHHAGEDFAKLQAARVARQAAA